MHSFSIYHRIAVPVTILFILLFCGEMAAQQLSLRFFDSVTGYSITPEDILLRDQDGRLFSATPVPSDKNHLLTLPHPGRYTVSTIADGYYPIEATFSLAHHKILQVAFQLDPVTPVTEARAAYLQDHRRADAMFISGFVSDANSGLPLSGARISLPATGQFTFSDERGYFSFYGEPVTPFMTILCEKAGFRSRQYQEITVWMGGDAFFRIRLPPGSGTEIITKGHLSPGETLGDEDCPTCGDAQSTTPGKAAAPVEEATPTPALLRHTIRVGRNCTGTSCTTVEVYTLQTYCRFVLPAEWIPCWGDLSNGMHSLKAGAVAVRTYGSWFVHHPLSPNYDICDNTYCQFFGDTQYSNTNAAVDQTARFVLVDANDAIVRSEYSAENNNSGCGDGWSGTGTSWPCIYDPVCLGQPNNGHGRGMCQWGSIRWANGTVVMPPGYCTEGTPHSFGVKTWDEILTHYYPDYTLVQGATAYILSAAPVPSTVSPGQTFQINYTITAAPAMPIMLGASVAPAGTGNWIDDPANDVKVNVNEGTGVVSRSFHLPGSAAPGLYDLLVALWYDVDNNNQINAGDFNFHSSKFPGALSVTPTGIHISQQQEIPTHFELAQNYPNPFNPSTIIEFSLPRRARVHLKIFDAAGREVSTLVNGELPAGRYQIPWNAVGQPSGIYFYHLQANDFLFTRKMLLVR